MKDKLVLVVGGSGYIGPVVISKLLADGFCVRCVDFFLYDNQRSIIQFFGNPNFEFMYGDHTDISFLKKALNNVTDVIVLSGLVGDPITKKYPVESKLINGSGLLRFIDFLGGRALDRVLFISTCSNYGLIESEELADESYPLNPLSPYARAKVAAEMHILQGRGIVDYIPTILRFSTAFGVAPRMRFDLTVNEFVRDLYMGKKLIVFDALTWRPYCHVRDFARLIAKVLVAPREDVAFEIFNAGGDMNNFTKQGIVDLIKDHIPSAKVEYQEKGGDPRNYRVSFAKVRKTLGFIPSLSVEDGILELINALQNHVFEEVDISTSYYGNYDINYKI